METRTYFVPSEKHDRHESRLHEECKYSFDGKRRAEYVADKPGIVAPVCSELEFKNDACRHAYCEIDSEKTHPELGGKKPLLRFCLEIDALHDGDNHRQSEGEWHKEPMIDGRDGKLKPRPVNNCSQI